MVYLQSVARSQQAVEVGVHVELDRHEQAGVNPLVVAGAEHVEAAGLQNVHAFLGRGDRQAQAKHGRERHLLTTQSAAISAKSTKKPTRSPVRRQKEIERVTGPPCYNFGTKGRVSRTGVQKRLWPEAICGTIRQGGFPWVDRGADRRRAGRFRPLWIDVVAGLDP